MASFNDPRGCIGDFFQFGRNIGRRPPSLSLRNLQRDFNSVKTRLGNIKNRVEGAIGAAARGEFLPGQLLSVTNEFRCPPTPYANYFSVNRPPKFKFMFFVSMKLNPDFTDAFGGRWPDGEMWWFIKQSGRPNISYEYEDVNMYNFRQKVLRRATFNPVQLVIYDDLVDASAGFWTTFLRIQSPVTNLNTEAFIENAGMNWADMTEYQQNLSQIRSNMGEISSQPQLVYSASTGILPGQSNGEEGSGTISGGNNQIIQSITVYHMIDWGRKFVAYEYINPRLNEINFDELTWESSDPSVIEISFEYDTFHIHYPEPVTEDMIAVNLPDIYPIALNQDETPFDIVNKGIDAFNTGVNTAVNAGKAAISKIPGFG